MLSFILEDSSVQPGESGPGDIALLARLDRRQPVDHVARRQDVDAPNMYLALTALSRHCPLVRAELARNIALRRNLPSIVEADPGEQDLIGVIRNQVPQRDVLREGRRASERPPKLRSPIIDKPKMVIQRYRPFEPIGSRTGPTRPVDGREKAR
jgi:hypothetical protein